jgi:hypothetical protein
LKSLVRNSLRLAVPGPVKILKREKFGQPVAFWTVKCRPWHRQTRKCCESPASITAGHTDLPSEFRSLRLPLREANHRIGLSKGRRLASDRLRQALSLARPRPPSPIPRVPVTRAGHASSCCPLTAPSRFRGEASAVPLSGGHRWAWLGWLQWWGVRGCSRGHSVRLETSQMQFLSTDSTWPTRTVAGLR